MLRTAHAALPGPEREVLAFTYLSGLAADEIGELMGLTPAAVEELRMLALRGLARRLWGTDDHARAAAAYAAWEGGRPAPAVRRAVVAAALDTARPTRDPLARP